MHMKITHFFIHMNITHFFIHMNITHLFMHMTTNVQDMCAECGKYVHVSINRLGECIYK